MRYMLCRQNGKVVCSCRIYRCSLVSRGQTYLVAGVGAVFTQPDERGKGYAGKMLSLLEKQCRDAEFDGMLLFSDIEPAYYEKFGYELLSDSDFHIWLDDPAIKGAVLADNTFAEDLLHDCQPELSALELKHLPKLKRIYRQFLPRQPFGIARPDNYWRYKIQREWFLRRAASPGQSSELSLLQYDAPGGGYAIFEQSGKIIKVLEVIGSQESIEVLWRHLLRMAVLSHVQLVQGWESAAPPPACGLIKSVKYTVRDQARPMLLNFNPALHRLWEAMPCAFLEVDHF